MGQDDDGSFAAKKVDEELEKRVDRKSLAGTTLVSRNRESHGRDSYLIDVTDGVQHLRGN